MRQDVCTMNRDGGVERMLSFIDQVVVLIKKTDGRDKVCKVIQYLLKFLLYLNPVYFKRFAPLAKQFSATRKILKLGRCLTLPRDLQEELEEQDDNKYCNITSAVLGSMSEFGDDICWASDMQILPASIGDHDIWADYLWCVIYTSIARNIQLYYII